MSLRAVQAHVTTAQDGVEAAEQEYEHARKLMQAFHREVAVEISRSIVQSLIERTHEISTLVKERNVFQRKMDVQSYRKARMKEHMISAQRDLHVIQEGVRTTEERIMRLRETLEACAVRVRVCACVCVCV